MRKNPTLRKGCNRYLENQTGQPEVDDHNDEADRRMATVRSSFSPISSRR
jgi:hypothetical protein